MTAFREYVTSTAFALTISHRQIECLCQLDQYGDSYMLLTTFRALENKGLAERVATPPSDNPNHDRWGKTVRLTEAGKAVVPLLKLAGLYVQYAERMPAVELPPIDVAVKRRQHNQETTTGEPA
ncbi:hypothetical protein [Paracidovorax wautersii]|uniref:Uncharacterized protein n=1 Tax=Paracidovorax wautersii TaxID=1177982 RepID=A0A1I2E5F3_9BURK|nr:hypothetical protein [Paracidovorax wautersii]SFE88164.1 hypothetical protein SAMN04489711_106244 [Paracidovorax wautersii]